MIGINQSEWFCSLPWTGFSNDPDGKVRPCCLYREHIVKEDGTPYYVQTHSVEEIFSSKYMKDLRNEFRNGKKPKACEVCIKDESNNYTSKRLSYLTSELGKNIEYAVEPTYPVEYQMILSNACNLKCRSCTPSHSNSWQVEHKVVWGHTGYDMPHGQSGDKKSVLWDERSDWLQHVKRLEIVGGEPFYISQWQTLWEELIASGQSKNIHMDMSSNATIYSGDIIKKLAENFKCIGVGLSIDGLGKTYNYLRHPGNWDEVKENLLKYHKIPNVGFSYSHTIGWLNAWELPEFHTWTRNNTPRFAIWNNIIHRPRHMSIVMLPKEAKQKIENKWRSYDWGRYKNEIDGIINFMYSEQPTDEEIAKEYKEFKRYDSVRNENILDIIPDELIHETKRYF